VEQMGRYQLVRRLASGGMAEVFLAKADGPMGFEKELVVKRILPHFAANPTFVEMFLAEAKLAAQLNHPDIVQIFDFGDEKGTYFIAMEYVDGLNLRTLAKRAASRGTSVPFSLGVRIVSLACEGLIYAHEWVDPRSGQPLRLVHRDVSPDNILISKAGGVKVADFGIAKASNGGPQTRVGVIKGKVSYLAPEYLIGQPIDLRLDVYALGVVLFELLTGRKPFQAPSEDQLLQLVTHQPAPDVRTLRPEVPEALAHIVGLALATDPAKRYPNCRQMQADLERYLLGYGEPAGALQRTRPASTVDRRANEGVTGRPTSWQPA
jgi:serine/threonine protein kinase